MSTSTQTMSVARGPHVASAFAAGGVVLGVCAGLVQLLMGSSIPQWTGNKLDPAGLGVATIFLSLVAAVALWQLRRPLPAWTRLAWAFASIACTAVCFTTVGRLWYLPGPLLLLATVLTFAASPAAPDQRSGGASEEPPGADVAASPRRGIASWIIYAASVVIGLIVALSALLTVLLGQGPSSVGIAAAVVLAGGLALSTGVAPGLRRRAVAMLAAGCGAGLMAGGVVLGAVAVMIALT